MKKNLQVAWCIWMEDLRSDLIQSQVLTILEKIAFEVSNPVYLIWFMRPTFTEFQRAERLNLRLRLEKFGVRLILVPFILIPRRIDAFFMNAITSIFITPMILVVLLFLIFKYSINVLHIRSYPAAPAALIAKLIGIQTKIIFDTRSPFPEESVNSGRWKVNSFTFKYWKWIERYSIKFFNKILVLSQAHKNELVFECGSDIVNRVLVFRNNADAALAKGNVDGGEFCYQKSEFNSDSNHLNFIYVGSLPKGSWNDPCTYAKLARILIDQNRKFHILFITRDEGPILDQMNFEKIPKHHFSIENVQTQNVVRHITGRGIGLNLMAKRDVRMSVKTAEYIAADIPIICTANVLGAVELVEEFGIGAVVTDIEDVPMAADQIMANFPNMRIGLARAREILSTTAIAKNLLSQYEK